MHKKFQILFSLVILAAFVLSACGEATPTVTTAPTQAAQEPTATKAPVTEQPTNTPEKPKGEFKVALPDVDPGALSGAIYAAGSSTVYPLIEAVAEEFRADGYVGDLKIDSIGSGAGFERFCKTGETDIANASRAIKSGEKENCRLIGREPIEFRVGTDALAVVVSKDNTFLTDVTMEELLKIFTDAEKWSDVNPAWPAEKIQRFVPGTDSGTFDFFVEEVIQKSLKLKKLDEAKALSLAAKNQQASEDDNVLVQGVEGSPYAIGYFGFAYYANEADNLKAISVDGVAPSFESAESGDYKLSRPLFIYSDAKIMQDKPEVAGFINYFLQIVNDVIGDVGYFPASTAALDVARQAWVDGMGVDVTKRVVLPLVDPADLEGSIYAAGSSTVYPLAEAIAEMFREDGFDGELKIDSVGSGAGFERFCKMGETDISNASRPIKQGEIDNCVAIGRTPVEFRVGTDALAIVVSKANTFLTNVTMEELALIFTTAEKWSDVNPAWPSEPIQRFIPGTDSGTFDFFVEEVIQKPQKLKTLDEAKAIVLQAKNQQASEDDNVLVQGVEGSPYAIGYFGYAYFNNQADKLTAISVEGVAPSFQTAESGEYKLARPLFIYSDAGVMKAKPQVAAFINYFLTHVNEVILDVGYFPASVDALLNAKAAWLEAMK